MAQGNAGTDAVGWPTWVPVAAAGIVLLPGAGAAWQRGGLIPLSWPAAAAGLAVLPWLLDAADALLSERWGRRGPMLHRPGDSGGHDGPLPTWLFILVVLLGVGLLLSRPVDIDVAPFLLVFLAGEMTARWGLRGALGAGASSACLMVGAEIAGWMDGTFIWLLGMALGVFVGFAMRAQLRLVASLQERERDVAERATEAERARIAREIHDVVAHSLSVVLLQITGARHALARPAPDVPDAVDALSEAERLGRESLADIRATIGLLGPGAAADAPSLPGAADLPTLVEQTRAAGVAVEFSVIGDLAEVPSAAGLAAYRIVQESISNAARHAPGAGVRVRVSAAGELSIEVSSDLRNGPPAAGPPGLGLRGMRERAELLGGELRAGAEEGRWVVRARLPARTARTEVSPR